MTGWQSCMRHIELPQVLVKVLLGQQPKKAGTETIPGMQHTTVASSSTKQQHRQKHWQRSNSNMCFRTKAHRLPSLHLLYHSASAHLLLQPFLPSRHSVTWIGSNMKQLNEDFLYIVHDVMTSSSHKKLTYLQLEQNQTYYYNS